MSAVGVVTAMSCAWWLHDVLMWSRALSYFATYALVFAIDIVGTVKGVFGAQLRFRNVTLYSVSSLLFTFLGGFIFVSLTNVTETLVSLLISQSVIFPIRFLVARKILTSQQAG
jgi:hypothetical protein